ncbi:hypothetical protein N9Y70_03110 [Methylophilaceae bacterium]|nr:hypothetical protein [Methylophilaceae bacterium]
MEIDDKWLLYRITYNILDIGLPSWNIQDNINISTPVIWPYILSVFHFLSDWGMAAKLFGFIIYIFFALLIFKLKKINHEQKILLYIGVMLYFPLAFWSFSTYETPLSTLMIFYSTYLFYLKGFNSKTAWTIFSSTIFLRPEMLAVIGSALIIYLFLNKKIYSNIIFIYISAVFLYFFYNIYFFDSALPETGYSKWLNNKFAISNDFYKILNSLLHLLPAFLINILIFLSFIFTGKYLFKNKNKKNNQILFSLWTAYLIGLLYHVANGYMHMGYTFRYFTPFIIGMFSVSVFFYKDLSKDLVNFLQIKKYVLFNYILIYQVFIFIFLSFYTYSADVSLTRAPHRDAMSQSTLNTHINSWGDAAYNFKIKLQQDRVGREKIIYSMNGNWLVGIAQSHLQSIDNIFSPVEKSSNPNIKKCLLLSQEKKEICLYKNAFDFVVLQGQKKHTIKGLKNYRVYFEDSQKTITVLKNMEK